MPVKSLLIMLTLGMISLHTTLAQIPSSCENPIHVCESDTTYLESHRITTEMNDIVNSICGIEDMAISTMYEGANWLRYEFATQGDFLFTLYPTSMRTDLDFYVFTSKGDCSTLSNIRCMLTGSSEQSQCMGTTGLSRESMDTYEYAGCDFFDDNYVASVDVNPGDILYVAIYNFSKDDTDYKIVHGGSANFICDNIKPQVRAEIYPNPSAGKLRITAQNIQSNVVGLEIYDSEGKNHLRQSVSVDDIIDISYLPSGVFIIKLHDEGRLISSQRIINVK